MLDIYLVRTENRQFVSARWCLENGFTYVRSITTCLVVGCELLGIWTIRGHGNSFEAIRSQCVEQLNNFQKIGSNLRRRNSSATKFQDFQSVDCHVYNIYVQNISLTVGSPPVSRILSTPSLTNSLAICIGRLIWSNIRIRHFIREPL